MKNGHGSARILTGKPLQHSVPFKVYPRRSVAGV
jgi:hypothetical protein